jgi:hypothetical protein
MNPCELVAKLNPGSSRLDGGGRGGVPEYTAQDVAHAIGLMGHDKRLTAEENAAAMIGREVFCAVWWPDGARLSADTLDRALRKIILDEYSRRSLEAQIAKLECHVVEGEIEFRRVVTESEKRELTVARARRLRTVAQRWPWNTEVYARMPNAVLTELRSYRLCPTCAGLRFVSRTENGPPIDVCGKCDGTGREAASKVSRAANLKISESAYRIVWGTTYDWTFSRIAQLEGDARRHFKRALGVVDAAEETA